MSNKEYEYIVKLLKRNIVCNNSGVGNSFYCNGFNNGITCCLNDLRKYQEKEKIEK